METAHTKGQWSFTSDGIFDGNNDQIASLLKNEQQYFKSRRENLANAKLIAAAPDIRMILNHICNRLGLCSLHEKDTFRNYYNSAKEVIEKTK
jgi:hypothetical protein